MEKTENNSSNRNFIYNFLLICIGIYFGIIIFNGSEEQVLIAKNNSETEAFLISQIELPNEFLNAEEYVNILDSSEKLIKVGLAIEGVDYAQLLNSIYEVSKFLYEKGIALHVVETRGFILTEELEDSEFPSYVKNSFANDLDLYMVFTCNDYFIKGENREEDKNISVSSFPKERVILFDREILQEDLSSAISHELKRVVRGSKNKKYLFDSEGYKKINMKAVKKWCVEIKDPFAEEDELLKNKEELRKVKVGVVLDDCTVEDIRPLFLAADSILKEEFGLELYNEEVAYISLNDSWDTKDFFEEVKEAFSSAEIYIMLSSRRWKSGKITLGGQAIQYYGVAWSQFNCNNATEVLCHEIAHLFAAQHDYNHNSIMHPNNIGGQIWTTRTRNIILKNKFRTWEWSK